MVVLTVWEPIAVRVTLGGAFAGGSLQTKATSMSKKKSFAKAAAENGAQRVVQHGYKASAVTKEPAPGHWPRRSSRSQTKSLARLIVCGQRGRSPLRTALLGNISHALAARTRRPVLIAPEKVL